MVFKMNKSGWIWRALVYAGMALVLIPKLPVIRELFALSLWPDMTFYLNVGFQPGFVLPVTGSVLTQIGGIPVIGIILVLLSMALLTLVMKKLSGKGIRSMLPAVFAFMFILGFDYSLYTFRSQGLLFSQTLGLVAAALIIWGWTAVSGKRWSSLYPFAAVLAGYPLIGAYAILAALGIFILSLSGKRWVPAIVGLVSAGLVPLFYTHFVFTHIDTAYTFVAGLPYMDFVDNHKRFIPLGLAALSLVLLPLFRGRDEYAGPPLTAALAVLMLLLFIFPAYKDKNFHIELAMRQAIERNDWDRVITLAGKSDQPTRVIVMYRNIALMYKGQLCDRMFTFPNETIDIDTPAQISQTEVCGMTVFFHNGLINYSARWAWEMSMMFQRTLERYKYLAKVALFTGQENPALVERYLDIVGENMYQRGWVKKYRSYLHNPELLNADPEYKMFTALNRFEEIKYMSSAVVENTILNHYLLQENPEGVMLDLSLAAAMTTKDTDMFWYYYDILLRSGRPIPKHVGEAAILFAYIDRNQAEIDAVARELGGPNSPTVLRFVRFSSEASAASTGGDTSSFKKRYGDTYWYYAYFTKSLTTN